MLLLSVACCLGCPSLWVPTPTYNSYTPFKVLLKHPLHLSPGLPPRVPRSPSLRGPWRLEGGRGGRKLRGHTRLRLQGPGVGRVKGGGHPCSGRQDRRDWLISPGRREKGKKNSIGLLVKILPCVEGWSPNRYVHLEHVNVTLFRKRVFADVINTRL